MDTPPSAAAQAEGSSTPGTAQAQIKTLLLLDMVDSTSMIERLGDLKAAEHIRRHDRFVRDLLKVHGGREIDKTDGFLLLFDRPVQAAAFALTYQRALKDNSELPIRTRIGLHVGEVVLYENTPEDVAAGAKAVELEGLAKPIAARLMSLALPGQILMSEAAEGFLHGMQSELVQRFGQLRWRNHGRYRLKGVRDALCVWELGELGVAPFATPVDGEKVRHLLRVWRTVLLIGLLFATGVGVFMLGTFSPPALAFAPRDWVVLADLDNRSGDDSLSPSISFALRQSLEQSRFVNVVPELQIRQALKLMQRKDSSLNREVAAEVAQREQASAVIQPILTSAGGKLSIALEVIEPRSTRTVMNLEQPAQTPEQLLPALDAVVNRLREGLGESIAQISADSLPLERLTTGNLDALRTYAIAIQSMQTGELDNALLLFDRALALDPEFAAAHARRGMLLLTLDRSADARAAWAKAQAHKDRLSEREQLYLEAQFAQWSSASDAVERWEVFGSLYPDLITGQNNAGINRYTLLNDYAGATRRTQEVVQSNHPLRRLAQHTLGLLQLAQGQMQAAELNFSEAVPLYFGRASWFMVNGQLDAAEQYLRANAVVSQVSELERLLRLATLRMEQGDFDAALVQAEITAAAARDSTRGFRVRAAAAQLAAQLALGNDAGARTLIAEQLQHLSAAGAAPAELDMQGALYWFFWSAHAARWDELAQRRPVAQRPQADEFAKGFPVVAQLRDLWLAELDLRSGDAKAAQQRLKLWQDRNELWALREALARASEQLGDLRAAHEHWNWLVQRHGLAHAEWVDQLLGQQLRVAQWSAATLCLARSQWLLGRQQDARQTFTRWEARDAPAPAYVAQTHKELAAVLAASGQPAMLTSTTCLRN